MKMRPDMLDKDSPPGLEVIQLTTEADISGSHVYMEAQIFTPDSKRLLLHRSAHAHGSDKDDPEHKYLLCNIEDNCRLDPLTEELGATAPSVTPDGKEVYYFVNQTEPGSGRLTLKRVSINGTGRQTVMVIDSPLADSGFCPSRIYPLSTISADGKRLALSCFFGDGRTENAPWGLMVFDLEKATVGVVIYGPSWCNMHPQYCRAADPEASHDLLIQENHGNICDAQGNMSGLTGGAGADIHLICDDGSKFRDLPWGRDGNEFCQGHQCWRGRSTWAITSTGTREPLEQQLIEGRAAAPAGHLGKRTPGAVRNDLSRSFATPQFCHFATDAEARHFITDACPAPGGQVPRTLYRADFGAPGREPFQNWTYLLCPGSSCTSATHVHPFLSPDGTLAFFNSDESGILQAYMLRGL